MKEMERKKITIIGTVHVLPGDLREKIRWFVINRKPEVLCIELDGERYKRLMGYRFLHNLKNIAMQFMGIHIGDDMRGAIEGAKDTGAKLVLMDMNSRKEILPEIVSGVEKDFFDLKPWVKRIFMFPFMAPLIVFKLIRLWLTTDGYGYGV